MSTLTLKDFANAVGVSYDTIKKHVQRGKVTRGTDGKIDTENGKNILYINEYTKGSGLFKSSHTVEVKQSPQEKVKSRTVSKLEQMHTDLDLRKKIADAEVKENEVTLKTIQIEKLAGKLLPVELVEKIFKINLQSIFKNVEQEHENLASLYVLDRKILSEVVTKQKILLARAIEKAKEDAMYEIEGAIMEYQDVRSRGERK